MAQTMLRVEVGVAVGVISAGTSSRGKYEGRQSVRSCRPVYQWRSENVSGVKFQAQPQVSSAKFGSWGQKLSDGSIVWGGTVATSHGMHLRSRSQLKASSVSEVTTGGGDGGPTGGGDGSGGGGGDDEGGEASKKNVAEALAALSALGKTLETLPKDFSVAIMEGRIPGAIVTRYAAMEKNVFFNWLMRFGGFKERLLADELFLTKIGIECGVGIFTKTAAELERRRDNFWNEFDFVVADVIMAIIADFMLTWLPAPTVALRPAVKNAGAIAKWFTGCPDNAFQVALRGTSYSGLQRLGAIVRNGAKLLVVGTSASLVGTGSTNGLIMLRRFLDKDGAAVAVAAAAAHDGGASVPILETSLAYGAYMAVSSNLRYQVVAGVIEQRWLEPMLHDKKLLLSALCFVVRTGNTFLGSLLWVDYARWIGIQ